jgi:hypothetical protein
MNVHLLSFVAGIPNYQALIDRFTNQARACSFIDYVYIISNPSQKPYQDFHNQFSEFIAANPRGYGYWLWKPYLVLQYLKDIPDDDVLLYCDIGCELSPLGGKIFNSYINELKRSNFVAFSTLTKNSERSWSKAELINLLSPKLEDLESEQVAATFFLIKRTPEMIEFIEEWLSICTQDNYIYLTDQLTLDQSSDFIEHRHDQSIFSLLVKKYGLPIHRDRTFFPPEVYYPRSFALNTPIHTLRSKGQNFYIQKNIYQNGHGFYLYEYIKYQIIFFWSRLTRKIKLLISVMEKS